jgi:hypothetical protein
MSYAFDSKLGAQLYRLLPEVYRTRDKRSGGQQDLARYLDAHGHLLDLLHKTLQQQLQDTLPESSQDWLLPYFAHLLAVNIVSPDADGKHEEVKNAVSWRQRKGTLRVAEEIAEAVGQMEVEIQEGWQRVAMTPRVGMPIVPVEVVDDAIDIDMTIPRDATRHPSLPVTMVDLRQPSRALEAMPSNPAAKTSRFGGVRQTWRQHNRHGVPCFPGSFDDRSRRTVDFRVNGHSHHKRLLAFTAPTPGLIPIAPEVLTWSDLHTSKYEHLIEERDDSGVWLIRNKTGRAIEITDDVTLTPARPYRVEGLDFSGKLTVDPGGRLQLKNVVAVEAQVDTASSDDPVMIAEDCLFNEFTAGSGPALMKRCTVLGPANLYTVDAVDCIFMNISGTEIDGVIQYSHYPAGAPFSTDDMTIEDCTSDAPEFFPGQAGPSAKAVLAPGTPQSILSGASDGGEMGGYNTGREGRPVRIVGNLSGVILPADGYSLADLIFEGSLQVSGGQLDLRRCAAISLDVTSALALDDAGAAIPAIDAIDCLFDELTVANSLARLEYCTIMLAAHCKQLQASDCLFAGDISDGAGGEPESGCLRFSRIPSDFGGASLYVQSGFASSNTRATPVFARFDNCIGDVSDYRAPIFGEAGYGVLHPTTPEAIRFGAEDGAEMGVGHHKYYSLKAEAVLDKMREFLPVGIEPVLIQDERLLHVPPEIKHSSNGGTS